MAVSRPPSGRARSRAGYRGDVAERRWAGSWLSGTLGHPETGDADTYPGQRFGLPQEGRGSVASIGRRLLAPLLDWLLCTLIALALFHSRWWTLPIFAVETYLLSLPYRTTGGFHYIAGRPGHWLHGRGCRNCLPEG